jgi:hypothetical protein
MRSRINSKFRDSGVLTYREAEGHSPAEVRRKNIFYGSNNMLISVIEAACRNPFRKPKAKSSVEPLKA